MVRLSATLRACRHDQGENPAGLGRADIEASCTAWRSCPPAGSCLLTAVSRPARTPGGY